MRWNTLLVSKVRYRVHPIPCIKYELHYHSETYKHN